MFCMSCMSCAVHVVYHAYRPCSLGRLCSVLVHWYVGMRVCRSVGMSACLADGLSVCMTLSFCTTPLEYLSVK